MICVLGVDRYTTLVDVGLVDIQMIAEDSISQQLLVVGRINIRYT